MTKDETTHCPLCGRAYGFINFAFKDSRKGWMCCECAVARGQPVDNVKNA